MQPTAAYAPSTAARRFDGFYRRCGPLAFEQLLAGQRRTEIGIALAHNPDDRLPVRIRQIRLLVLPRRFDASAAGLSLVCAYIRSTW